MALISLILSIVTFLAVGILLLRKPSQSNNDLAKDFENADKNLERAQRTLQEEIARNRTELNGTIQQFREELHSTLTSFNKTVIAQMAEMATSNKNQLDTFSKQLTTMTQINEQRLEKVRDVIDLRLKTLQEDNGQR